MQLSLKAFRASGLRSHPSSAHGNQIATSLDEFCIRPFDVQAGRWSAGEVSRVDLQRQEVSVEYENRVKTAPFLQRCKCAQFGVMQFASPFAS